MSAKLYIKKRPLCAGSLYCKSYEAKLNYYGEKIDYRKNLKFSEITNENSHDVRPEAFWDLFNKHLKKVSLSISDDNYELQLSRIMGINYLKYLDKQNESYFITERTNLSDDIIKNIIVSFCESGIEWKSKLEWEKADSNDSTILNNILTHLIKLGIGVLLAIGYWLLNSFKENSFSVFINSTSTNLGVNSNLIFVLILGIVLLSDMNNIKNFKEVHAYTKFRIIGEILFFLFVIIFFL